MDQASAAAPHFLRHVADLAERHAVVAQMPIHTAAGVKLVDRGERITRAHYDDLARHKLQASLEDSLAVSNGVTAASLRLAVDELVNAEAAFAALLPDHGERDRLVPLFATLPLAPPLAFKLTVAREERPEVLDHSLKVAYCAAALAYRSGLPHHEIVNAAAAGLFHDLGLLHVDPDMLRSMRPLQEHERNHLYAHPLTAYLILERSPIWHPVVSTAVLEHHERLDGSGYPQGLSGDKLGQLGQLLAVAELAATLLSHAGGHASRARLEVVLSMNQGKLNHDYCNRLLAMFPPSFGAGKFAPPPGKTLELLVELSVIFMRWQAIARQQPEAPLTAFIDKRLARLGHSMADIGIDFEYWSAFSAAADFDPQAGAELEAAAREGAWQVQAIASEVRRRWEHLSPGSEAIAAAAQEWLASVDCLRRQ